MVILIVLIAAVVLALRIAIDHRTKDKRAEFRQNHQWDPPKTATPQWEPPSQQRRTVTRNSPAPAPSAPAATTQAPSPQPAPAPEPQASGYPGDYEGRLPPQRSYYDNLPSGGDVVRARVPERGNHAQGHHRDVVVVAREHQWLLGVEVTYDVDASASDRVDIAAAEWDAERRPAQLVTDRIVRLLPEHLEALDASLSRSEFLALRRRLDR